NFALNQYREWLLTSCGLGRYIGAEVEQTLTHARVIQCLVDGIAERVANRLRRALWGKQRKPRCRLKFRQPCLFRGRDIRNDRVTFGSPDCINLEHPGLNMGAGFRNAVNHVVNLAAHHMAHQDCVSVAPLPAGSWGTAGKPRSTRNVVQTNPEIAVRGMTCSWGLNARRLMEA